MGDLMLWDSWRRIDPALHRFVGFTGFDPAKRVLARMRLSDATPAMSLVHDALFVPISVAAPDIWATGGVMTGAGDAIPCLREKWEDHEEYLGFREPVDVEPVEVIDGEVLYLGWLFDSFGHLLLESLARIWALAHVDPDTPVVFQYVPGHVPQPHVFALLDLFGLRRERILLPSGPVRIRRLLMPDPMLLTRSIVHERAGEPYRAVAERIADGAPLSEQPLYFSRRMLPASQRAHIGEAALEEVLRDNGFRVEYPERLPLVEQIRLAATHRTLVTSTGSASHLAFFARPGAEMHIFCYGDLLEHHIVTSEMVNLPTTYLHHLHGVHYPCSALAFDLQAATAFLADAGLLPRRSLIPYLPTDLDTSPEHAEAWLFTFYLQFARSMPPSDAKVKARLDTLLDRVRPTAWPVFVAMAAMPEHTSGAEAETAMRRYAAALAGETDALRRERHRASVLALLPHALARCTPETRVLAQEATDRFLPATRSVAE